MSKKFVQPGTEIELGDDLSQIKEALEKLDPAAFVILLWSPWGVEGVYTSLQSLKVGIDHLRMLGAYQNELVSIEFRVLNPLL